MLGETAGQSMVPMLCSLAGGAMLEVCDVASPSTSSATTAIVHDHSPGIEIGGAMAIDVDSAVGKVVTLEVRVVGSNLALMLA